MLNKTQNYLIHSARIKKNFTKVIAPCTGGPYHARFPTYNSILTKPDIQVFEIKYFKCSLCAVYSVITTTTTITITTKLYPMKIKIISVPIITTGYISLEI